MKRPSVPLLLPVLVSLFVTACGGPVEDTRPGQPVKQRQDAFKALLRAFEPMGTMLRTGKYEADPFAAQAAELMKHRDAPWSRFGADTDYPPSKARADVWRKPEAFEREKAAFLAATDGLLAAANSRDEARVRAAYDSLHATCKSCHKAFKD